MSWQTKPCLLVVELTSLQNRHYLKLNCIIWVGNETTLLMNTFAAEPLFYFFNWSKSIQLFEINFCSSKTNVNFKIKNDILTQELRKKYIFKRFEFFIYSGFLLRREPAVGLVMWLLCLVIDYMIYFDYNMFK